MFRSSTGGICQSPSGANYYNSAITTLNNFGNSVGIFFFAFHHSRSIRVHLLDSSSPTKLATMLVQAMMPRPTVRRLFTLNVLSLLDPPSNGNFIMYPNANDGTRSNNYLFSAGSISRSVIEIIGQLLTLSASVRLWPTKVAASQCLLFLSAATIWSKAPKSATAENVRALLSLFGD